MRVVFMGTPQFAVPSLRALAEAHDVVAVYSRPDSASGRGRALRPSAVKEAALELAIPVLQPKTLRDTDAQAELAALTPDVIVVAAYGLILPAAVLEIPAFGCINVHGSLLPRWRGAAPIQRAILAGDEVTGVSIMQMEEGLDTGAYCEVAATPIDNKTTEQLALELAELGAQALIRALQRVANGTCEWTDQDEAAVTYAAKIEKSEVALTPDLTVAEAVRRVRASSRQAPARLSIADTGVTVVRATTSSVNVDPGAVACSKHELVLGFADGSLCAERIKPDGKGEMSGCDWARGAKTTPAEWGVI